MIHGIPEFQETPETGLRMPENLLISCGFRLLRERKKDLNEGNKEHAVFLEEYSMIFISFA